MPIKAYVGLPRHGKTYEVVTEGIFNALVQGRRVVSNIAGLNRDAMLAEHIKRGGDADRFGELASVTHEQVLQPLFWLSDKDSEQGIDSFIKPGDFLALDEIWRFWQGFGLKDSEGGRRPDRVMNFLRMHGHFTHPETGYCCEVAFITQELGDFHRSARAVIEETYRMTKLVVIGSAKRYRVDIFPRGRTTGRPIRSIHRAYNPDLFGFYSSHSQRKEGDAAAIEDSPDQRGNILRGVLLKWVLPLGAIGAIGAGFVVWKFLHPSQSKEPVTARQVDPALGGAASAPAVVPSVPSESNWRVVGYWGDGGVLNFYMSNGSGSRVFRPQNYKLTWMTSEVQLPDGSFATSWASALPSAPQLLGK